MGITLQSLRSQYSACSGLGFRAWCLHSYVDWNYLLGLRAASLEVNALESTHDKGSCTLTLTYRNRNKTPNKGKFLRLQVALP